MNQIPKKLKILYKRHISKSSKPTERKTTNPKPLFIKVSMKPHLRSLLSLKPQRKYRGLSNKNTKVLTESRKFLSNLSKVND